jgi:hypothetical protein
VIEVLEPNGRDVFGSWGLGHALDFDTTVAEIEELCGEPIRVRAVGSGLQTALGLWHFDRKGGEFRGYSVCSAVCLWIFARFTASDDASLRVTDQRIFEQLSSTPTNRHDLQRDFQEFMRGLNTWRAAEGEGELRKAIVRNFKDSNVIAVGLAWKDGKKLKVSTST